jgi:hypothetical protein
MGRVVRGTHSTILKHVPQWLKPPVVTPIWQKVEVFAIFRSLLLQSLGFVLLLVLHCVYNLWFTSCLQAPGCSMNSMLSPIVHVCAPS